MKQEDINALLTVLKSESDEVYKSIMENNGVMKEPGEMPVTQAIKVYTRRRDHLAEKGNAAGSRQLTDLLRNLGGMPNSNIRLLSVYYDFGGFTVFTSSSNKLLGIYNVDTNANEAVAFLQRAKAEGTGYPKLYKLSAGRVAEIIE